MPPSPPATGSRSSSPDSGSAYTGGPGVYATLSAVSGGYQVIAPDGTQLNFGSSGQLTSQTDRSGSGVTLAYTGGQVTSVTGTGGRSVGVGYTSGLLTTLTMPSGHTVTYGYTSGRLASVTDLRGGVTRYGYNCAGQLTTVTDPDGNLVLTNIYTRHRAGHLPDRRRRQDHHLRLEPRHADGDHDPAGRRRVDRRLQQQRPARADQPDRRRHLLQLRRQPGPHPGHRPARQRHHHDLRRRREHAVLDRPGAAVLHADLDLQQHERGPHPHRRPRPHHHLRLHPQDG